MQIYAENAHFYLRNKYGGFLLPKITHNQRKFDALSAQFSKQNYGS